MPKQKLEIECPVCDAKLSIDARSCPKCGADLRMADFQDLENLAKDISGDTVIFETAQVKVEVVENEAETETSDEVVATAIKAEPEAKKDGPEPEAESKSVEKPKEEKSKDEEPVDEGKKKGIFSKFFGKKK
jgi:ribosomal protein L40E